MKYFDLYKSVGCKTSKEVFEYIMGSLKESNTTWDYFVNWGKVIGGVQQVEVSLNILNTLVGKNNFDEVFVSLLKEYPAAMKAIPILLACREHNFKILITDPSGFRYEDYDFNDSGTISDEQIKRALTFVRETGIAKLFKDKNIKNVVDYVTGVEVGLDSNGRKNRSGVIMEDIVEVFVKKICADNGFAYLKEATSSAIKDRFGCLVPVDKASRRYDFAVFNGKRVYLIETNFYGGGGSKLKATAGEYEGLHGSLKAAGHPVIWITDGLGWRTAAHFLEETFNRIDFLLNLALVEKGFLAHIIKDNL